MGYTVSVTVANLVMEYIEDRAISCFHSPPPSWKRYADDIFTTLPEIKDDSADSLYEIPKIKLL